MTSNCLPHQSEHVSESDTGKDTGALSTGHVLAIAAGALALLIALLIVVAIVTSPCCRNGCEQAESRCGISMRNLDSGPNAETVRNGPERKLEHSPQPGTVEARQTQV